MPAHLGIETTPHLRRAVRHEVATDLPAPVGQARVQQQSRRLDAAGAHEQRCAPLPPVDAAVPVDDAGHPPIGVTFDPVDHALGTNLGTVGDRLGQIGGVHAGLRGIATALVAGTAVHAGLAQPAALLLPIARHDRCRCVGNSHTERRTAAGHHVRRGISPGRWQRIPAFGIPGVCGRAGDADETLDSFDVAHQFGMGDRPVVSHTGQRSQPQVARIGTRREGAPMQGRSSDAGAAVVRAEGRRRGAAAQAFLHPVDVRAFDLVGCVFSRRPVAPGLQRHDPQAARGQRREQRRAPGAGADHHRVDHVALVMKAHRVEVHRDNSTSGSHDSRSSAASRSKPCFRGPSPPLAKPSKPMRARVAGCDSQWRTRSARRSSNQCFI